MSDMDASEGALPVILRRHGRFAESLKAQASEGRPLHGAPAVLFCKTQFELSVRRRLAALSLNISIQTFETVADRWRLGEEERCARARLSSCPVSSGGGPRHAFSVPPTQHSHPHTGLVATRAQR